MKQSLHKMKILLTVIIPFIFRYRIPAINSPSKEVQSVPSRAPESTSVNLYRRGATCNKPAGVVIHSKCCCRHQKQDGEQRAALKSRSFGSLRSKEVHPIIPANHFAKPNLILCAV